MTPAAQTSEPQTAAGRAVATWSESNADLLDKYGFRTLRQAVLAIEAEAFMDGARASRENRAAIESEAQRHTVDRLHQYLHDEGVWPDDDEAWHLRVCEGYRAASQRGAGLREALERLVYEAEVHGKEHLHPAVTERLNQAIGYANAALAAAPAHTEPPAELDMERLREAFTFLGSDDVLADGSIWTVDEMAERVAAAYAEGEPE